MNGIKNFVRKARVPVALSAVALLAGCGTTTWQLDAAKSQMEMAPPGDAFLQALAHEYVQIADYEAYTMNDWLDSYHFAGKALAAANGEMVMPDPIEAWGVTMEQAEEFAEWRGKLVQALDGGLRSRAPERAACAQANFDWWMEQTEEGWQEDHIAHAKDKFLECLGASPQKSYVIYFAFDSSRLDTDARATVDAIAADVVAGGVDMVEIVGHTDSSGNRAYNQGLSTRRADSVRNALVNQGVDPAAISARGVGESNLAIQTGDGVREAWNRRVVVTLN